MSKKKVGKFYCVLKFIFSDLPIDGIKSVCFIYVEGMSCSSCVSHIEKAVLQIDGVSSVFVGLMIQRAEIKFDSSRVKPSEFVSRIESLGFKARVMEDLSENLDTISLDVSFLFKK